MTRARSAHVAVLATTIGLFTVASPANVVVDVTSTYKLSDFVGSPTAFIRVEDKVFSEFTHEDTSDFGGNAPSPAAINVTGVKVDYGNGFEYGLRFSGNWSAVGEQLADTIIRYKVTADDPWLIIDNTLWMSASGASDAGVATISESVYRLYPPSSDDDRVAAKYVYDYDDHNYSKIIDHFEFPPGYEELWIVKDVAVNGGGEDTGGNPLGSAHISEFYQTFSQVPEPATLALTAAGALVLVLHRRRRR